MITAKINVIPFAISTGKLSEANPYENQSNVPNAKSEYMDNEIAEVSFVLIVFIACGRNDVVVQNAADKPSSVIKFISNFCTK